MVVGRAVVVVLGLLFVTGGVVAGAAGWINYQNTQSDVENAVEVEGEVLDTSIEREEREVDNDNDGRSESTETSYRPVVSYTYTYRGENYTSDSVYPGSERSFDDRDEAEDVLDQFSQGESATVHVNEETPSRSFLVAEESSTITLAFAGGAGLVGVLVGLLVVKRGLFGSVEE